MAELASGAVTSLLGVIRNEWRLLGRVGGDVHFIREEMESMNSFLMHLARTTPPGGEHDEQVRTWMSQVRLLAQDCNNCIDLYLYRGNPDIHLGSDRLRRYLRWVPWFLQKMWAQHRAALELSDLKERAGDVGQRRLRYGVEVPKKTAAEEGGNSEPAFAQFEVEEGSHEMTDASDERIRRALFGLYVREDYFNDLLGQWINEVRAQWSSPASQGCRCVAFVVPSTESGVIARQAKAVGEKHVNKTILVDIPSLHYWYALGPKNILYYILREIQQQQQGQDTGGGQVDNDADDDIEWERTYSIRQEKRKVIHEIKENIGKLKVDDRIQEITAYIEKAKDNKMMEKLHRQRTKHITKDTINKDNHDLGVLLVLLLRSSVAAAAADETEPTLAEHYDDILKKTAEKLREHMEQVNTRAFTGATATGPQISVTQYAQILQDVFQKNSSPSKNEQAQEQDNKQAITEATPGKNQIREIIDKVKQEILSEVLREMGDKAQEATKTVSATTTLDEAQVKKMIQEAVQQLKEEKPADKKQETCVPGGKGPTTKEEKDQPATATGSSNPAQGKVDEITEKTREILDAAIKVTTVKMKYDVQSMIERQLVINGIVAKIQNHLKQETLIILKVDEKYVSQWEQTRNALCLLPCVAIVMILTKTETNLKRAKQEYCYPKGEEPKDYSSLAALYHGIVLKITGQQNNEYNNDAQILRNILDKCEPNELCMKIFAHALYAKPKRSNEELHRLHDSLQAVLPQNSYRSIAMKMFKFSYWDMPKDYQSCLLYLAIFPRGHKIRRSTLIGRWVAEGMITTEDWRWSNSVQRAEQCFEAFVTRGLVYSAEAGISATRRVKSCMVGDLVHEFITEIAKKQRILEARLSHHLAHHFSIFNDLHLRSSDQIDAFLKSSSESSQWSRLKVLDLESCKCFMENRRYLKNICNNIFLLKYLCLRRTDVNWLPPEINNLRELEVLDIQETEVPENSTKNLLLLKLKRLLAGKKNASTNSTKQHVLVPEKIEKMLDMEVLSNVKAKSNQDFDGITKLWQLRKLGVVVEVSNLTKLLQAISDLHECLQTLSITLDTTRSKKWREPEDPPKDNKTEKEIKDSSKVERLSISGNIPGTTLLQFFNVSNPLIKVTLSNTSLSQQILYALSQLSRLHCLKLRDNTYSQNKLTFRKGEFEKLKYFLVEGSNRIEVSFEEEAAKELEKIVLSFDSIQSITGVDHLPKLEELEINHNIKSSSSSSGSITAVPQPAIPPPPPTTATPVANDPVLPTTTATDAAHSTPITAAAAIPSSSAPAATAVANDPIPSTVTTTDTANTTSATTTIPSSSAATTTIAANNPVLCTTTATDTIPTAPTTAAIPSPSAPAATDVANDPIPSTATTTDTTPTPATSNIVTTIPSPPSVTATAADNDPILSTATTTNPTPYVPAITAIPSPSTLWPLLPVTPSPPLPVTCFQICFVMPNK